MEDRSLLKSILQVVVHKYPDATRHCTTGHIQEQGRQTMDGYGVKVICAITIAQATY